MAKYLKKIFDSKKDDDLIKTFLDIKKNLKNKIHSDIGLLIALNDARLGKEDIYLITKKLPINPVESGFVYG